MDEKKGVTSATCRVVSSLVQLLSTATALDKWKKTKIILSQYLKFLMEMSEISK